MARHGRKEGSGEEKSDDEVFVEAKEDAPGDGADEDKNQHTVGTAV